MDVKALEEENRRLKEECERLKEALEQSVPILYTHFHFKLNTEFSFF